MNHVIYFIKDDECLRHQIVQWTWNGTELERDFRDNSFKRYGDIVAVFMIRDVLFEFRH